MTDTKKLISTLEMPEKVSLFKELYNELAGYGVEGDTELAHVNTFEARWLKSMGGSGSINDITGLREYKGGGGSPPPAPQPPSSVTQTSEFPTELRPFIKDVLGEAKTEFQREKGEGYIPFGGPQLAQFTPEQQQAFETGREQFGARGLAGTPLAQASTYYQPALAATALGTSEIGTGDIQRRMDPFLQNVVDIAKREAVRDEDLAAQGRAAQAVGAGSFGGSRQAILEAEAERNLGQRLGDIQAQGLSQAFQNAQRAAEAQRARELSGGRQFAGLGESAFQRARGDITGLAGIGEAQQGRTQQALDLARREFEEEKAFPSTALQRYSSLIRGWGLTPNQTVVSTPAPVPRPGLAQQLAGAAGTGIGLYGQFGGFDKAATGGLVGLMGGGTPMNPLRPPYELFPAPTNRQYNAGGIVGLGIGGTPVSNTVTAQPNQPAPSGGGKAGGSLFHRLIGEKLLEQLRDQGFGNQGQPPELGQTREPFNVNLGRFVNTGASYHPGAATGGLLGLTVSKHQAGQRPTTGIYRIADMLGDEIFTFRPKTTLRDVIDKAELNPEALVGREYIEETSPEGAIAYDIDPTDEVDYTSDYVKAAEAARRGALNEALTTTPESGPSIIEGLKGLLPVGSLENIAKTIGSLQGSTYSPSTTSVPVVDVQNQAYNVGDPELPYGLRMDKPANETLTEYRNRREAAALEAANQAGADIDQAGADEPIIAATAGEDGLTSGVSGADDPPPDPFALPDLPEGYDTAAWESAQKQYLDALKAEAEGGGQDKWEALTQLGLNLMSEHPQYQGESLLSIDRSAGKEPLAALQEAQKDQKAARLSYLKANVDIEGQRANLKSNAEQKKFDNILRRFMAGVALTEAEYKLLGLQHPKGDAVSITAAERAGYKSLFEPKFDKLLGDNIEQYALAYTRNKNIDTTPEEALRSGVARLRSTGSPENEMLIQRSEEIMATQRQKNKDEAIEKAIEEWILAGGTFRQSNILTRLIPGQSKGTYTQ